jgi:hypothetical protein
MAKRGRPKRSNPQAERKIFKAELESCPACEEPLTSVGNSAHSIKTVQTFAGEFHVVAYSRLCDNPDCDQYRTHYHAVGHLQVALPGETYGLDVVAFIGWQRDREHRRFSEIKGLLNDKGIAINERSVGRLYRLYQALIKGGWKKGQARLAQAQQEHGGLIVAGDGLKPEGCGGTLYVLYEVLSGTPVSAMWLETRDAIHLTAWLRQAPLADFKVLATMSDHEDALVIALRTVWSEAPHQLCQEHFISRLSEPIHAGDQALQASLQAELGDLPKLPKLSGGVRAERAAGQTGVERPAAAVELLDGLETSDREPLATSAPESQWPQKKRRR